MYCEQCGKWNEDGRKNCFSCGSPLKIGNIPEEAEEKVQESADKKTTAGKRTTGRTGSGRANSKRTNSDRTRVNKTAADRSAVDRSAADRTAANRTTAKESSVKKERRRPASSEDLAAMEKELQQLNQKTLPVAALIMASLVMVIILVVLFDQIPKRYGPKKDAEAYETAILSGQWDAAYEYLYMPGENSKMLTKETFANVMDRSGASGFRDLVVEEVSSTDEQKVFSAVYDTAEGTKTDYLTMCPTGNKKMLFMKEWKVDPVTVCTTDVTITVPEDTELLVNGMKPETEPVMHREAYTKEYTIPKMFMGIYSIELQAENRDPYYDDIQVSAENRAFSYEGITMEPDQALMDALIQQFGQNYQAILEASVNRADFSTVEQYFTRQAVEEGRAQNLYANACSQAYDPERGTGIIRYQMSDIKGQPVSIVKSGYAVDGDVVMEIRSVMSYSYIKDGMEMSDTQNSAGLLCFHQEDGQWKIQSFS